MTYKKLRVLMDLKDCFSEGFGGIPQETRLLFSSFLDFQDLELCGLINHYEAALSRGISSRSAVCAKLSQHQKISIYSKLLVSYAKYLKGDTMGFMGRRLNIVATGKSFLRSVLASLPGFAIPIDNFEAKHFSDFVWEMLFSKTMPTCEFDRLINATFRTMSPPWGMLQAAGFYLPYPRITTQNYDVLLAQSPFPGKISKNTQLVVRYHDAIHLFQPHLCPYPTIYPAMVYKSLKFNAKRGIFVCTSESCRADLLSVFSNLEQRSLVIPDIVSDQYFEEPVTSEQIAGIIQGWVCKNSEPSQASTSNDFYEKHLKSDKFRYLLMVSTLEPRKNHIRFIQAWESLGDENLKLVLVGNLGWNYGRILDAMLPWQKSGQVFHLSNVPIADLRKLYNGAACVVCPSVSEGFDLSGVEAMLSGAKVAASDIPVHREIYGKAAAYFHPYSIAEQARTIASLINHESAPFSEEIRRYGLQHGKQYLREAIAPQWEEFFVKLHKDKVQ